MKKKHLKKFLAGLLCISVLAGNNGTAVMAASSSELPDDIYVNDTNSTDDPLEEEPSEIPEDVTSEISEEELPEILEEEPSEALQEDANVLPDTADNEEAALQPEEDSGHVLDAAGENDFVIEDGVLKQYTGSATEIVIPETVTKIANDVFKGKNTIESVQLPGNLTEIGRSAFEKCTNIKSIAFPNTLKTIGEFAFSGVNFGERKIDIEPGVLTIPGSVESIGHGAFYNCAYLGEVVFEESDVLLAMASSAAYPSYNTFGNCPELTKVTLPKRLRKIDTCTFMESKKLEQVVFREGLTEIGNGAFQNCVALKEAVFPSTLEKIGNNAFDNCTAMQRAAFPNGLKTIGEFAFSKVNFGEKKTDIEPGVLTIPGSVESIGHGAFYNCAYLGEVVFEEGDVLLAMASSAAYPSYNTFGNCPELTKVTLPKRLRKIDTCTFMESKKLEQVVFREGLTEIGNGAFQNCVALKEAVFPSTLEKIGNNAFDNCTAMQRAAFPNGLKTIGEFAFSKVNFGEKKTDIEPGVLTIPGSVESIGQGAFYGCAYLGQVVFEEGEVLLKIMSSGAYPSYNTFGNCPELTLVSLPARVREIHDYTFSNDPKLEILCIPADVTNIHENAVDNCPKAVIYGTKNSPAETYANSKKIPFKDINELDFSVSGVSVTPESIIRTGQAAIGEQIQLRATVIPAIARNKKVTYVSDNEDVASVDDQGLVTLKGFGTAQITVTTEEGGKTAICQVKVQEQGQEDTYTVSFDLQERGTKIPDLTGVRSGSKINEPAAPQAIGYLFTGWYKEAACIEPWNFAKDTVDEDTILYAGWDLDDTYDGILEDDMSSPDKEPSEVWVAGIKDATYTGQAITQRVRVYDGERRLEEGLEYTVSYKNNKNATGTKNPEVIVTGKGNYKGFKEGHKFSINPVDLGRANGVLAEDVVTVYKQGKRQDKLIPTVTYNGKTLKNKKDFTVSYDGSGDYTAIGTYPITIKGKGNFAGTIKASLKIINGTPMSKVKVKIPTQKYNDGQPVEPDNELQVKAGKKELKLGTNYTVTYKNNKRIGTATAVITGVESSGYVGTKRVTFKITGTALSRTKVTGISSCTYNGSSQKQMNMKITLKGTDEVLKENEDYTVKYSKNKNAGKATITITGIGAYSGVVKKTFKIQAYKLKADDKRLGGLEEIKGIYDNDGQIKPEPELTFDGKKLIKGKDYTLSYKNYKKTSKGEPQIIIKGKGNFTGKVTMPITVQE